MFEALAANYESLGLVFADVPASETEVLKQFSVEKVRSCLAICGRQWGSISMQPQAAASCKVCHGVTPAHIWQARPRSPSQRLLDHLQRTLQQATQCKPVT